MSEDARDLSADEMAEVARFGIHDELEADVMPRRVRIFQLDHGLSDGDLRGVLREYRRECEESPWEPCMSGILDADFVNWFHFERETRPF